MAHSKQTWAKVRAAYRRGEAPLRELAKRFGIHPSTVMQRAAREKWEEKREQTARAAEARAQERDIESVAQMLARHRRGASLTLALAIQHVEEAAARKGKKGLTANQLDVLSGVIARMAPVERLAAGIEAAKPVRALDLQVGRDVEVEIDAPPEADEEQLPAEARKA